MSAPVLTIDQMRRWEAASWASGRSSEEVIREVGRLAARQALAMTEEGQAISIWCGKGHNGDDARCAAPHLKGRAVEIVEVADPEAAAVECASALSRRPALLIDGLFGIGLNRPLSAPWAGLINQINAQGLRILSVDVPSGLNADTGEILGTAIKATVTLTLGAPKAGFLRPTAWAYVGRLEVAPEIGLVPEVPESVLQWVLETDFGDFPPPRPAAGHKGSFGHLAVVAGSEGYHGAAVLAARGAQRAQPGLVSVFTAAYLPVASQLQAVMVHPWRDEAHWPGNISAAVMGPGLAADKLPDGLEEQFRRIWQHAPYPVVVDASGLGWLPTGECASRALRVITPHPGEAARLLGVSVDNVQADRTDALRTLSRRYGGCWVVLKGNQTQIGHGEGTILVNSSGNPFLGQGGTGDLLAGFLGGFLAQPSLQSAPAKALSYAAWAHGRAAEELTRSKPNWCVEDLSDHLGNVTRAS